MFLLRYLVVLGLTVLTAGTTYAQYPTKPIRLVTSSGSGDFAARIIAQGISGPLGQQIIVENRPGALPGEIVSKAAPDGYTLLVHGGAFWNAPLFRTTPYDPIKDFSPITLAVRSPNVLVVHPSLPVKSVRELIALAKARPGQLNYTSGPAGGASHLTAELFKALAGVNITRIGYASGAQELADLLSGAVHLTFNNAVTVTPHIRSGRLRGLAVGSPRPSALFPGLPALAETVPGFESAAMAGVFAPGRTPEAIIER